MEIKGKIIQVGEVEQIQTNNGLAPKQIFVIDTGEKYDNIIAFDLFGDKGVNNFAKFNAEGQDVTVSFNIKCNEYKGKYYTNLSAWMAKPDEGSAPVNTPAPEEDDGINNLPF